MASLTVGLDIYKTKLYVGLWNETKNMSESFFVSGMSQKDNSDNQMIFFPDEIIYGTFFTDDCREEDRDAFSSFVGRILDSIRQMYAGAKISKLGITYGEMDENVPDRIKNAVLRLGFKDDEVVVSNHANAFFMYMFCGNDSLKRERAAVFDMGEQSVKAYYYGPGDMRNGLPAIVEQIDTGNNYAALFDSENKSERLECFSDIIYNILNFQKKTGCLFVTGAFADDDGFKNVLRHYASASLKVYVGQNLYSDGICLMARFNPRKGVIFDGEIFYRVMVQAYDNFEMRDICIISEGTRICDAKNQICLIPDNTDELKIKILDMRNNRISNVIVSTEGLLSGENKTNRLLCVMNFADSKTLTIKVRNVGFGEINPANYKVFEQTVNLKG